ncbi:helix-hairpin-helix domain-containing protein [Nonomuraea sp. NPDC049714]|uniref:helix-hairpin-helix domain-containing protein n=1 Tax=Nonomuraea sp. NPDC049714 TaxID=3364357 RepID=UPI0037A27CBA
MRTPDPTAERTIAESRLRSITTPERAPLLAHMPATFQEFRAAVTAPGLDPGRPGLRVLLALAAAAVIVAGFFLWRSQPTLEPLAAPTPISSPPPAASSRPSSTAQVTVHVAGKVRRPGVYSLPMGARVTDAVTAAGGVRKGAPLGPVNLARRLTDGEQILVGATAPAAVAGAAPPETAILDLNSATPDQLEQLPGVGEVLASRIVDYRTTHGAFTTIDQLRDVSGIGAKKYEEIKPKVRV